MAISFGRDNPHCSRCGDERGGDYGHETSECVYRSGVTVGDLARARPDRAAWIYEAALDQWFESQGVTP
jgi:hypothetical protein